VLSQKLEAKEKHRVIVHKEQFAARCFKEGPGEE
jgi:hypothetical protein